MLRDGVPCSSHSTHPSTISTQIGICTHLYRLHFLTRAGDIECGHETTVIGVGVPMKALRILGCMAIVTVPLMADLAFAQPKGNGQGNGPGNGQGNGPQTKSAPAPLIGVGLPMAGAVLLTFLLVRRFRQKD
jgi:hypothetical protein